MGQHERRITLIERTDHWVAIDERTGVGGQGPTREAALDELDDAVELRETTDAEPVEDEEAVLRDLGIDPESVEPAEEPPEFMQ